ncbi:hypothetical protein CEXT_191691 [Caerostris extrusa]|uniref:Uncharacterized protein n=1 Tax=Caerostris extrusa TaxID=172846 RepID=A0AAV4QQC7_CAEEX|nr:hypothetical protein CEXT_191691 [Caerostris extrusa]
MCIGFLSEEFVIRQKKPNRNLPCLRLRCPQETNVPYNTFVALKEDNSKSDYFENLIKSSQKKYAKQVIKRKTGSFQRKFKASLIKSLAQNRYLHTKHRKRKLSREENCLNTCAIKTVVYATLLNVQFVLCRESKKSNNAEEIVWTCFILPA